MKIRRVYKRDKDGQFAKVNTLLGAAADAAKKKRLKSKAHSLNRVPSKSDRRSNRNAPDPQVLDAAAGKLSLAEGPAREIAKKHDLSGHNRSEANKAAYRECAKYARELKAKYGADAPTADRIYSAAKLIQKGGDIGAKIRQEEGDGNGAPNPLPPKPPKTPPKMRVDGIDYWVNQAKETENIGTKEADYNFVRELAKVQNPSKDLKKWVEEAKNSNTEESDYNIVRAMLKLAKKSDNGAPKKPWREQKAIDELLAAQKNYDEVSKKYEGYPKPQNSEAERAIRAANNRLTNAKAPFLEGKYSWPDGYQNGFGLPGTGSANGGKGSGKTIKPVRLNDIEKLGTSDLIDQYNLASQGDRKRIAERALAELKGRASFGDQEAFDFLYKSVNGPKMPAVSINELNKRIARAARMLASSPTNEEKQIYQGRIDTYNAAINDRLATASPGELAKELKEAQRDLANARRDVKIYALRAKEYPNNETYKTLHESAKREVNVNIGTVNKIKTRLDELHGRKPKPLPDAKATKQLRRNDDTDPPVVRQNREKSVNKMFDTWFDNWAYEKNKDVKELAQVVDYKKKVVEDPEFQKQILSEFLAILKDPSPLDNLANAWTYNELNLHGYHDLTTEERSGMAEADVKLLENWLKPEIQSARMDLAFKRWLEESTGAQDLANNYGYNTDDLFDIFMDNSSDQFSWNSDYFNMHKIADENRSKWRKESFDGASLAKAPRPPAKPDPKDVAPVPYRAKDNSIAELRREKASMERELAFNITKVFGTADFSKRPKAEQDAERAKYMKMLDDITKLDEEISNTSPDRSKSISAAKTLDELHDIFSNRNPKIKSLAGWNEPDGDLVQEMEKSGVYSEAHKRVVLSRCVKAFEAAERMSDDYSEVPFDGLNARSEKTFSTSKAIAHCSRGRNIHIEMNVNYLVKDSPAPTKNSEGFHPQGFEKNPFYNVMIHEFGHSMDWFAFGLHDVAGDTSLLDRNMNKGVARDKIWHTAIGEIFDARDVELKRVMVEAYLEDKKTNGGSGTFDDFYRKHTSGYARTNYHELIAESWQDYQDNGPKATPISIAVTRYVLQRYQQRLREGMGQPYVIKTNV